MAAGLFGLLLGAAALVAGGSKPPRAMALPRVEAWDTTVVWGPHIFETPTGSVVTHIEVFDVAVDPDVRYELKVEKGDVGGAHGPNSGRVFFNNVWVTGSDAMYPAQVKYFVVQPTDTTRIKVDNLAGDPGDYFRITLLAQPNQSFPIFGPKVYPRAEETWQTDTLVRPAYGKAPYQLHVVNGNGDGTNAADSARIQVNGVNVITKDDINAQSLSAVKPINLDSVNVIRTRLRGPVGITIRVTVMATDSSAPELVVDAPAEGAVIGQTSVLVSGTVADETAVQVTANNETATIDGNGAFSVSVPLTEGSNDILVRAHNAAGLDSTVTRHVTADTQVPALTVTTPANGLVTAQPALPVSGTVSDATATGVTLNGVPLTVTAGSFSSQFGLADGLNLLTFTATDAAGNEAVVAREVTLDTIPPVLTVTAPADASTTAEPTITVQGSVSDLTAVTVVANGTNLPVTSGSFSGSVALAEGPNTITVTATDAAGNPQVVNRSVTRESGALPPDPATVAPPLDQTVATTLGEATEFLYTGADPIQTGVVAGTIDPVRVAVVRGRVLDTTGQGLPGVAVSVLGHSEYGSTLTRVDGAFDLAVNGGGEVVLDFQKVAYLRVHRHVAAAWQEFVLVDDVVLTTLDPTVSSIDFTNPIEVGRGSVVSDLDGTRQATVLFRQGTAAEMVMADGTVQSLPSLQFRATEYTVGNAGESSMPAQLPPTSGYTYAVEFSDDQALAAGAVEVRFDTPVVSYVENFLDFPVGMAVPAGYYDRAQAMWMPANNGRVIKILSILSGTADIDTDGDDLADSPTTLAVLGIDDAERAQLALLYPAGQTLWRVEITHFTPWDWNWPFGPPPGAEPPRFPEKPERVDDPCTRDGSVIEMRAPDPG